MAASVGSHGTRAFGGIDLPRPSTVVMAYTGHRDVGTSEPPTFIVVGKHDGIAPPAVMRQRADALRAKGAPVEFHEYSGVGHGFGLGIGTPAEGWLREAVNFWSRHGAGAVERQ